LLGDAKARESDNGGDDQKAGKEFDHDDLPQITAYYLDMIQGF